MFGLRTSLAVIYYETLVIIHTDIIRINDSKFKNIGNREAITQILNFTTMASVPCRIRASVLLLLLETLCSVGSTPAVKPHIVFALVDDWGSYDVAWREKELGSFTQSIPV